jgi:hypothetical protein
LERHSSELMAGAIITAEPGRLRIRPPEDQETDTPSGEQQ